MTGCPTKRGLGLQRISGSDLGLTLRAALLLGVAAALPAVAEPVLPQGAQVAQGSVDVAQPGAGQMTITQGTNSAVVNWNTFSIGQGGHVDIVQPSQSSNLLNRVTGNTTSEIHGRLTANGNVHLVNPNGIFIGKNGAVDAGGFVASTLDIADEDFAAGRLRYEGTGSSASVENAGAITIVRGGYAALLGGRVDNSGTVVVPYGRIGFGAGERMTLNISGDQFLEVAMPSDVDDNTKALIEHSGTASAEGGLIEMRAATARHAARNAINLSGVAEARSVSVHNGTIVLGGGQGGRVKVSGKVTTRAKPRILVKRSLRPKLRGGQIDITGAEIQLSGAEIDASGAAGGGLIRIGGDFAGAGDLQRADILGADAETLIRADALHAGDGGRIVLWSEVQTDAALDLSARGGDQGGDGGFIEVSSRRVLNFSGLADRRAPLGVWGTLLLDPTDFTIDPGAGGETTLEANLALGDVTLDTSVGTGTDTGIITINADIEWTSGTTLELLAETSGGSVVLNGALDAGATGTVDIATETVTVNNNITANELFFSVLDNINETLGPITVDAGAAIDVNDLTIFEGNWVQQGATLAAFDASLGVSINGGSFLRVLGGDGSAGDPYQIADIYGLQGMGDFEGSSFSLANDIDASATSGWSRDGVGGGFEPIDLSGQFDGGGFTISDLSSSPEDSGRLDAGLFDTIDGNSRVSDLTLTNVNIVGANVGALAVANEGTITGVRVESGTVDGESFEAGGFVASNDGLIEDSLSGANVVVAGSVGTVRAGGFVGDNFTGTINRSHATGTVTVNNGFADISAGGFAGREGNAGLTINDSYATGNVTVTAGDTVNAGGFVGLIADSGVINTSYSTGAVSATGTTVSVGGFAGVSNGTTGAVYWDTDTSGQATSAAGTGLTTAQFQDTETFFALATAAGWDFDTWAPGDTGFYPVTYSTSAVVFAQPADIASVTYGQTATATTTGTVSGGPDDYLFDADGDTLDTSTLFDSLTFAAETVGDQTFELATTALTSSNGVAYRLVDRPATATVVPAALTITTDSLTKTYGETVTFDGSEFTTDGLVTGDSVTSITIDSAGAPATAVIPESSDGYAITGSDAVGTGLGNYTIAFVDGTLAVNPAALTITANDQTKTYGETFTFAGTEFTTSGLLNSDTVTSLTLASDGAAATALVAGSPYAITGSDAVGTGLENYTISYVDGAMTVNTAALTITADDQTKTYGETFTFDGTEFSVTGLLIEDSVGSVTLTSAGAAATADVAGSPYTITPSDAVGTGLENYTISYVDGAMTVNTAALTITADDQTKTFGETFTFDGTEFSVTGLLIEDSVGSVTLTSAGAAATADVAGSPYTITPSDAVGTGLENYTISFVDGAMTVETANVIVTANDLTKTYGETLSFAGTEFTTSGILNSDTITSVTLASDGAVATAGVEGSPYTITPSDAVGLDADNYTISYVAGALTVDPAALTITASDQAKLEGEELTFAGTEFTTAGLVYGDTVTSVTLASNGAAASASSTGSPYDITVSDPVGTGLDNYTIALVAGTLTVGASIDTTIPVPPPVVPPNPTDNLSITLNIVDTGDGGGDGDGTGTTTPGSVSVEITNAENTLTEVEAIAESLSEQTSVCDQTSGSVTRYLACLSDSLDGFADALDDIATDLPPGMQNVARIVQDARVEIDQARRRAQSRLASATTDAEREAIRRDAVNESRAALANAADEIRKSIALVRAEDPELATVQRATVTRVASAVDNAGLSLARATGL